MLLCFSALLLAAPTLSAQTIVALAPTAVTLDSLLESSGSEATNLINQSGLSSTYTSGSTTFATATGATHSNDSGTRWVSNGDTSGSIIFDLGGNYTVEKFALWNQSSGSSQAVRNFSMEGALNSDFSDAVTLLSSTTASNTSNNNAVVAESFDLTSTYVRYLRWNISDSYGNSIAAAKEILFGGYLDGDVFDANVPDLMDAGGSSGDLYQYILGGSAAFDKTFSAAATLGSSNDYNQLIIRNASAIDFASGQDQLTIGSDHNTVTVKDSGSSLTVATFTNNGTSNSVQVTDGGLIDVDSLVLGDSADLTISIDGSSSSFQRDTVSLGTGATLATTVGNGGTYQVHDAVAESITLNDGGTLHITSLDTASSFELDSLASLTFESGATIKSDVAISDDSTFTISSGRTVDISGGGSFASTFELDGGTVATATFDYTGGNLTFTSGTHEASGALSNVPTVASGMTVDISGGGSFATATTLDGGQVNVGDLNLATDNLTFTSGTLDTSGTLTVGSDDGSATLSGTISGTGGITKSGSGTITLSGTNTYSGDTTVSGGTLTLGATDTFSPNSTVTLADASGTTLDLNDFDQTISGLSGGGATGGNVDLGSATLTIDSDADATAFAGIISGTGSLAKTGTGTTTLSGASTYTGGTTVSAGTLAVDATGSITHADSNLVVGNVDGGSANLTIASGGTVTNDFGYLGFTAGSTGNATVEGTWNNDSFRVGYNGDGHLTIQNGGLVANIASFVGYFDGSDSSVTVRGGSLTNGSYLRIGYGGEGTVTVADGGTISAGGSLAVTIADLSGSTGTLNIGEGGAAGIVDAPFINGGSGTATLNFNHTDSDYHLTGDGTSGGTAVNLTGSLAVNHLGTGTTTLDGTNTYTGGTTISAGTLVGDADALPGSITVNGGNLSVLDAFDATHLTFTSGTVNASGSLTNLPTLVANNTVDLTSGGSLGNATKLDGGTLQVGGFDGSNLTTTSGTITATGALTNLPTISSSVTVDITSGGSFGNAATLDGGTLSTGAFDYSGSNLTFTSGTHAASGALSNVPTIGSDMTVDITSDGSFATATTLDGGTVSSGAFDYSTGNLTLTSGAHELTGALTNLNTLGANQNIVLNGSSATWSPTGDIDAGSVTLDNNAILNVSDFDASNLTFTDGTLGVSGQLTNLTRSSSNQVVELNSGGYWISGDNPLLAGVDFQGGTLEAGDLLDAEKLFGNTSKLGNFTSGTVKVTGDFAFVAQHLFDFPELETGAGDHVTLDLTAADSISIPAAIVGIQLGPNSTVRFGDIDSPHSLVAENASGSKSRVEFTGAVTNLDVSNWSLSHEIVLDGGTLSETEALDNYDVTIQNGGHLTVDRSAYNASNLTFTNGTLTATGSLTNLPTLVANTTVDLSSGGSFGNATTLDGGTIIANAFNVSGNKLTFTSGTLEVSGALTNLNTLSAGQAINLNGASASWSPSGDIDDGAVTLQNDASLTVGDYDATNLTFTAGTLETTGALTNLNSLAADQTVELNGGSWSPSGNIDDGNVILHNTGQLTVGDYDASNLAGVSGDDANPTSTLTTTGTLTNVNHSANLNIDVILDGGTWADSTLTNDIAITIQNGGSLTTPADYDATDLTFTNGTLNTSGTLTNLNSLSANNTVVLDGGSWSPSGNIDAGSLTLQNSAALTISDYDAANLTFTSGSITTDGALTNLNTLNANNTITLDGSGASWSPTGNIDAGTVNLTEGSLTLNTSFDASNLTFASAVGSPVAQLTMNTGSLTNLNTLQVDQRVTLNGDSTWAPSGDISGGETVLNSANAHLTTSGDIDGRVVTFNAGTFAVTGILSELNSLASSDQTVELSGGSAAWSPTGSISTGNVILDGGTLNVTTYDATNLTATSGTLNASGALTNLPTITAGISVDITGGGSIGDATTLNGGSIAADDFDASNLTFNAGSLQAAGTLTGLTDLASGTTARVDGSSALALMLNETLALDGGTLEVANGANATALGSGAITFDGTNGGNIALENGTLNVASMGTTLTLNANATITGNGSIFGDVSLGTGGMIDGDATGLEVFGHISGTGTVADTTIFGNVTVGNSPGDITLENTTLSASTIVSLAIEGTEIGEFDRLFVDANSDVSAASLEITFENFTPASIGLTWSLVSNSSGTQFASISTPSGWSFSNGTLSAVPEPGTFALLAGLFAIGFTTTRRRGRK